MTTRRRDGADDEPIPAGIDERPADVEDTPRAEDGSPDPAGSPEDALPGASAAEPDERYLRLAADFENFRRRKSQELVDRSRYASQEAATALLPVLDNLRRAIAHANDAGGGAVMVGGLELVVREFETALAHLGVAPIEAEGKPFDPAQHEAIGGEDRADVDVDTVVDEVQRGYRLHDRVIRPSLVRVAHPASPPGGNS